jgi:tetratricopeptide (TPR) repeat protein
MIADDLLAKGARAAREGRTDDAIAVFGAAIAADPSAVKAHLYRGHLHADLGDADAALADFTQVTRLQPGRSEGWNGRGRVHFGRGDWARALDEFTRAAGCEAPTDLDLIERNRAECLRALGALDEAEVALDRALALRSDCRGRVRRRFLERGTGFEPATFSLGSPDLRYYGDLPSTTESRSSTGNRPVDSNRVRWGRLQVGGQTVDSWWTEGAS